MTTMRSTIEPRTKEGNSKDHDEGNGGAAKRAEKNKNREIGMSLSRLE